jgi:hypothetical protein
MVLETITRVRSKKAKRCSAVRSYGQLDHLTYNDSYDREDPSQLTCLFARNVVYPTDSVRGSQRSQ